MMDKCLAPMGASLTTMAGFLRDVTEIRGNQNNKNKQNHQITTLEPVYGAMPIIAVQGPDQVRWWSRFRTCSKGQVPRTVTHNGSDRQELDQTEFPAVF